MARLEVEQQTGLTDLQKRGALQTAEQALGPAQRAQRAEAVAHLGVQSQTAAFESAGVSASERFAQRSAQYGTKAATRLSQLDTDNLHGKTALTNMLRRGRGWVAVSPPPNNHKRWSSCAKNFLHLSSCCAWRQICSYGNWAKPHSAELRRQPTSLNTALGYSAESFSVANASLCSANPFCGRWKRRQPACWPARPDLQLTTTVGVNPVQILVSGGAAKRAFKAADARVKRRIGQVCVAAFAIRAELKHGVCYLLSFNAKSAYSLGV